MAEQKCFLPVCHGHGSYKTVKVKGINTLKQRAQERGDTDVKDKLVDILDRQGDQSSVECHSGCYCSYTSKEKLNKCLAKKIKTDDNKESPVASRRRSQLPNENFNFKLHCLFCAEDCLPINTKHPERWDRIRQCETKERGPGVPTFREILLHVADQRNDEIGRRLKLNVENVIDLPAADGQYHVRCYNNFMKVPKYADMCAYSHDIDDDSLRTVIEYMYGNQNSLWNSVELHDMYVNVGGKLGRKQMFNNLANYMSSDVHVVRLDGCASIIGFREVVGKSLNVVKLESDDDDGVDTVVHKIRTEARALKYQSGNYDLGEFTHENILKQTSSTLLKLISMLVLVQ